MKSLRACMIACFIAAFFSAAFCAAADEGRTPQKGYRFAIFLAEKNYFSLTEKKGSLSMQAMVSDPDRFTLRPEALATDTDIDYYDWTKQELVLTEAASGRMLKKYGSKPIMEIGKVFVVVLDGERLYGGAATYPQTAMYLNLPVIFPENGNGRFIICIRPSIYFASRPHPWKEEARKRNAAEMKLIEDPRIRSAFEAMGKLRSDQ